MITRTRSNRSNQAPLKGCSTPIRDQSVMQRLTAIGFTLDPKTGCLEWNGRKNEDGYGVLTLSKSGLHEVKVHRLIFDLLHPGVLADGDVVRHYVCDNPACGNDDHLAPGSQKQNVGDMFAAGRARWQTATQCDQGHALTTSAKRFSDGSRCVTCYIHRQVRAAAPARWARLAMAA